MGWIATLSYDKNGDMTSKSTSNYTWNTRNQLTGITGGTAASFLYDALGRRESKTISSTSTNFLYDGLNLEQELNGTTPTVNYLTGTNIDETLSRTDSSGTESYLTDNLGSTLALTNSAGAISTSYSYEPYGNTTTTGTSSTNALQYTGRENDGDGLYYNRARYYSPVYSRFISEDPLGIAVGVNSYVYALGDPVNFFDPLGLWGFGAQVSGSVEGGVVVAGYGATGSAGAGVFGGGSEGLNAGAFASGGEFIGGPGYGKNIPAQGGNINDVGGYFAGLGIGVFATNAKCVAQLAGPMHTYSFNLGMGPLQFSVQLGESNGTWIFSLTAGPGIGITGGAYNTNTITTP